MYRLLIVDDEKYTVESIQKAIDWASLGIGEVYTAFNIRQAKEVLAKETVDLMLCDIEMPQGSGLELLAWVREERIRVESIFLTCHADFAYAKHAIQLGSFDYLVKPVPFPELETVLRKAIGKIADTTEMMYYSGYGQLWFRQQPQLVERFWLDILIQTIPPSRSAVIQAAKDRNLPYPENLKFLPILISVKRWHKEISVRDEKILEYALGNAAEESLLIREEQGILVKWSRGKLIAILPSELDAKPAIESLKLACASYTAACHSYFYCDISCYIGEPVEGYELSGMAESLERLDRNNVISGHRVMLLKGEETSSPKTPSLPDMDAWGAMMEQRNKDKIIGAVEKYFREQADSGGLDANLLYRFYQDFIQMVYHVLKLKGIQAHQLFNAPSFIDKMKHATRSIDDLLVWVRLTVSVAVDYMNEIEQTQSVVDRVAGYIRANINKELMREDIAATVYLSPGHLTRIFKKKTGLPLSEFILREKLKLAEELLVKSDMSISAIAAYIGYSNFSHFSKIFKKHSGLNPNEYRQARRES